MPTVEARHRSGHALTTAKKEKKETAEAGSGHLKDEVRASGGGLQADRGGGGGSGEGREGRGGKVRQAVDGVPQEPYSKLQVPCMCVCVIHTYIQTYIHIHIHMYTHTHTHTHTHT